MAVRPEAVLSRTFWGRVHTFNEHVGLRVTLAIGTMWITYLFFLYGFVPLVLPALENQLLYWSNTLQLWLLPAIMVGQNVLARVAERQAQRQYEMVARIDAVADQMHTMLMAQDAIVQTLLTMAQASRDDMAYLRAKNDEIDAEVDALTAHQAQEERPDERHDSTRGADLL